MVPYHIGWDYFTPEPGSTDKMLCKVCATEMLVRRNVEKPKLHDAFYCKLASENWHLQALALKRRIDGETSQKITELLQEELNEVLNTRQTTKVLDWAVKVW